MTFFDPEQPAFNGFRNFAGSLRRNGDRELSRPQRLPGWKSSHACNIHGRHYRPLQKAAGRLALFSRYCPLSHRPSPPWAMNRADPFPETIFQDARDDNTRAQGCGRQQGIQNNEMSTMIMGRQ
jgi:hypothetical protein